MYNVIFSEDAEIDTEQVMDWYENIYPKLGSDFYDEVLKKIENIVVKYPKIAQIVYRNARKLSLNRFPYNLIYTIDDTKKEVQILAIVHDKRDPSVWKNRVT
ncbi:MAG: type II toxin-antitoxin system RelE/ParE family toxin [Bacteroidales bacterium]|nr:type II toxin-antitoxin system RelE/ParE family toxin [Bacteroidales bacterium]